MITIPQLSAIVDLDPTVLRTDAREGVLKASLVGNTWIVEEQEAERYAREVAPLHQAERRKPRSKSRQSKK